MDGKARGALWIGLASTPVVFGVHTGVRRLVLSPEGHYGAYFNASMTAFAALVLDCGFCPVMRRPSCST